MNLSALKALAPTQSELPFLGTQVVVLLIFLVLEVLAAKRFSAEAVRSLRVLEALGDCVYPAGQQEHQVMQSPRRRKWKLDSGEWSHCGRRP